MKTILVRYYDPREVMDITSDITEEEIKKACFRADKFKTEAGALFFYAETRCTWSTLLDDVADPKELVEIVQEFINTAYEHIVANDIEWLEEHFV